VQVSVLESGEVAKRVLLEELGGLPVRLHGEGLVVVELDASEGGGSENTSDTRVAFGISYCPISNVFHLRRYLMACSSFASRGFPCKGRNIPAKPVSLGAILVFYQSVLVHEGNSCRDVYTLLEGYEEKGRVLKL